MIKKLIEFLVHFSDFSYNIIANFYVEIFVIYQIFILQKFKAEMKIPAKIRSENISRAQMRSRQRMQVMTTRDGKPNKSCCDRRTLAETKTGGTFKEDNVATRK